MKTPENDMSQVPIITYLRRAFKRAARTAILAALVLSLITNMIPVSLVQAANQVPKILNYQARLTDSGGVQVPNGPLSVKFVFYDGNGTCLYTVKGTCGTPTAKTVTVTNGVFSTLLGNAADSDNEIPDTLFDNNVVLLGVTVGGDSEMTPRKRISAAPYALNADKLDDLDVTSSGSTTPYVVATTTNGNLTITGDPQGGGISNGAVYVNPAAASANETIFGIADNGSARFQIDKEGDIAHTGSLLATSASSTSQFIFRGAVSPSVNIFEVQDSFTNRLLTVSTTSTLIGVASNGYKVGIGTLAPTARLHIVPEVNDEAITVTGYSLTGSSSESMLSLSGTWNTSSTPIAINVNITDTASSAASYFMAFSANSTSRYLFRKDGVQSNTGTNNSAVIANGYTGLVLVNSDLTSNNNAAIQLGTSFISGTYLNHGTFTGNLQFATFDNAGVLATRMTIGATNTTLVNLVAIGSNAAPANQFTVGSGTSTFEVNSAGNLVKVNNVAYSWPSSQGGATTVLQNNGSGTLTWASASGLTNLNQAYLNATGTPQISITNSQGALTVGDSLSGTGNIFELRDMTNPSTGAYSSRYFTVSSTSTLLGLTSNGTNVTGYKLGIGNASPTAKLHITPDVNDEALTITGFSNTGSSGNSLMTMSGTWNTSGAPIGLLMQITDTASAATSDLMLMQVNGVNVFEFNKNGQQSITGRSNVASIFSSFIPLVLYNTDKSANNVTELAFSDGNFVTTGLYTQVLSHVTGVANFLIATYDNAGSYATRMTVGATSTAIVGNLTVTGTISGTISTTLNQAYLNATGTPEIAISPSIGAVTIADTFSGTGNIFEITDRTNSAGDYSRRYFTVSSTATIMAVNGYEVGIGIADPTTLLHLKSTTDANSGITIAGAAHTATLSIDSSHVFNIDHTVSTRIKQGGTTVFDSNGGETPIGNISPSLPRGVYITPTAADIKGVVLRANGGQSADLMQWQSSTPSLYGAIGPTGKLGIGIAPQDARLVVADTSSVGNIFEVSRVDAVGNTAYTARYFTVSSTSTLIGNASSTYITNFSGSRITGNLTPSADATYTLGDPALRWKDLWLSGGSANIAYDTSGTSVLKLGFQTTTGYRGVISTPQGTPLQLRSGLPAQDNSGIYVSATNVGINMVIPKFTLDIAGTARAQSVVAGSVALSGSNATTLNAYAGFSGYTNVSGGVGTGGGDSIVPNARLTSVGNLINIGSIQGGETLLTSAGILATKVDYTTATSPYRVAIADVNADGKLDMAVTSSNSTNVSIFINDGAGAFAAKVDYTTATNPRGVALGDVNGDGKADMAVANNGSTSVSIFVNDGYGAFGAKTDYTAGTNPHAVGFGDLNGDGKLDMVVTNNGTNNISVFINNGDGTFGAATTLTSGTGPAAVSIGDVSGDGKADIAVVNDQSGTVSVFRNRGDGTFNAKSDYATINAAPQDLAMGDLSGDGKADLVVASNNSTVVSVYVNNGNGTFAAKADYTVSAVNNDHTGVAIGDLNGDGKADVAVSNAGTTQVSILMNNGDGTLATRTDYTTGSAPRGVAIADLNSDGKSDVAVVAVGGPAVSVLLNTKATLLTAKVSSGNVGVGNSAPASRLTVGSGTSTFEVDPSGNIVKINNVIYSWPSSQGGATTVLQNNGSGGLTWTLASGLTNLNQAYLNATGTTEIYTTNSQGAVTFADTFSGTGNIFEITDRTNAAGDYSRQYLTVSSTSTQILIPSGTATAVNISNGGSGDTFRVNDDGTFTDTTPFLINNSGLVGIGQTVPVAKLQVTGGSGTMVAIQGGNSAGSTQGVQFLHSDTLSDKAGYVGSVTFGGGGGKIVISPATSSTHQVEAMVLSATSTVIGPFASTYQTGINTLLPTAALTLASNGAAPVSNIFEVQNRSLATGDFSARYFTVSSTSTLVNPANTVTAYKFGIGSAAPTAILDITGQSNVPLIEATGFTTTGTDIMVDLAGTWNTASNVNAIRLNMTETLAGSSSNLISLQTSGAQRFMVRKDGLTAAIINANTTLSSAMPLAARNSDLSTGNFSGLIFGDGNANIGGLYAQFLSHEGSGVGNLQLVTRDNSGGYLARMTIGATNTTLVNLVAIGSNAAPANQFTVGSGTSTFEVNSAGNLVKVNNVAYSWPSSQGGASTVLQNNGSGTLTWTAPGSLVNLNQAYLGATGTPQISITNSQGALTVGDSLSGTGNIFELRDMTNPSTGAYSSRYFTVSSTSTLIGLTSNGTRLTGYEVGIGQKTPTAKLHITPDVDATALAISGYNPTGSNQSEMIDLSGTWNTSLAVHTIQLSMTDTLSGSSTTFMRFMKDNVVRFNFHKDGVQTNTVIANSGALTNTSIGLKLQNTDQTASNIASLTFGDVQTAVGIHGRILNHTEDTGELVFATNDNASAYAARMTIGATNTLITNVVGIGNNAPANLLTVGSGTSTFEVNSAGNLVKVNNVAYSWPSSQGGASTVLQNNGSGTLTWTAPGSLVNLNQAYLGATGTPQISITNSQGALTVGDSLSGTGNIFELRDMTNPSTGAYSRRYFTVSSTSTLIGLTSNGTNVTGYEVGIGQANPTAKLHITPDGNQDGLNISGASITGSAQNSLLNLTGTWNTSGVPAGIIMNITDTASNGQSTMMQMLINGTNRFIFQKTGGQSNYGNNNQTALASGYSGLVISNTDVSPDNNSVIRFVSGGAGSGTGVLTQYLNHANASQLIFMTTDNAAVYATRMIVGATSTAITGNLTVSGSITGTISTTLNQAYNNATGSPEISLTPSVGALTIADTFTGTGNIFEIVDRGATAPGRNYFTVSGTSTRIGLSTNGTNLTGYKVGIGQATPTAKLHITPDADDEAITVSGYSLTGSSSNPLLTMSGTWNTSAAPIGMLLNITDTASASAGALLVLQVSGTNRFSFDKNGAQVNTFNNSSTSITTASILNLANTDKTVNNWSTIYFGDGAGIGAIIGNQFISHGSSAVGNIVFNTRNNAGSFADRVTIGATNTVITNLVGIGTANPTEELDVNGQIRISQNGSASSPAIQLNDDNSGIYGSSSGLFNVAINGSDRLRIGDVSNTGATLQGVVGSTDETTLALAKDGSWLAGEFMALGWRTTAGTADLTRVAARSISGTDFALDFYTTTNGTGSITNQMTIDHTGYVGIGNSAPANKLTVGSATSTFEVDDSGNIIKINNVIYSWPSSQGGGSTVLQNDGSGGLSWAASGASVNLNQAYLNATGTAKISLSPSLGAVTIADTVGSDKPFLGSNIFEITDRTNAAGDYSQRFLTVSSTSTNIAYNTTAADTLVTVTGNSLTTGKALAISQTGTGMTSGSLLHVTSPATGAVSTGIISFNATGSFTGSGVNGGFFTVIGNSTTGGTLEVIASSSISTGGLLALLSTSNALQTGRLLRVTKTGTAGTSNFSGAIAEVTYTQTYTTTSTLNSGNVLLITRAITENGASTQNVVGAVANFSDDATLTSGTLNHGASVVEITQRYASSTGTALKVTNSSYTSGGALIASYFEPLSVAGYRPSPTSNLFSVQNTSSADGISYTARYFTISSTSTLIGNASSTYIVDHTGSRITGNLTPSADNTYTLGDPTLQWKHAYIAQSLLLPITGNIGIGTSAPNLSIDITRSVNSQIGMVIQNAGSGGNASTFYEARNGALGSSDRLLFGVTGTGYTGVTGWQDAAVFSAQSNLSGGLILHAVSSGIHFEAGANGSVSERMFLDTDGDLGIGNTDPASRLTVGSGTSTFEVDPSGNIVKINNVIYSWPSSQGGGSTVLQNDGSGGLTWAASGASVNLNQAYLNATGTAKISLSPSLGAVTIADTVGSDKVISGSPGYTNIFEISDRTNAAGDYSRRILTVSSTSTNLSYNTNTTDNVMSITASALTTGSGLTITAGGSTALTTGSVLKLVGPTTSSTGNGTGAVLDITMAGNPGNTNSAAAVRETFAGLTTGNAHVIQFNALTNGRGLLLASNSDAMTGGNFIELLANGGNVTTAYTGSMLEIVHSPTVTGASTAIHTGNELNITRTFTVNGASSNPVLSGAVALFSDNAVVSSGSIKHGASVVEVVQNYASATGTALKVTNSSTTGGGAYIAGKFEPLTVAGYMPSPTSNLFSVQNTSAGDGISYTTRYFTVSSTSTNISANTASADPILDINQAGTGDSALRLNIVGDSYIFGIDNSAGDVLKLSYAATAQTAALGTGDYLTIMPTGNVAIGDDDTPWGRLTVDNGTFALQDPDVGHTFTSSTDASVYGYDFIISGTAGGRSIFGLTDTDATALVLKGLIGSTDPTNTTPAVIIRGAISDGGSSDAVMGNSDTVFGVDNNGLTRLLTVLGGGNVGIGNSAPASRLTVGSATSTFEVDQSGNIVKINGVIYSWPSSQGGGSTVLQNDGSGGLSWAASGAAVNLNQAYLNATGTAKISLSPSLGAVTIADTVGSDKIISGSPTYTNIFEVTDRTNAAGDYSRRILTVSSTSTNLSYNNITSDTALDITTNALTTGKGLSITQTNSTLTSGSLLYVSSPTSQPISSGVINFVSTGNFSGSGVTGFVNIESNTSTGGTPVIISANALTSANNLYLISSSNAMTSGGLLQLIKSGTAGTGTFSGAIAKIDYTQTYTTTSTTNSGNQLRVTRVITGNGASTQNITGAVASFSDDYVLTTGWVKHGANVVAITQNFMGATNTALNVTSSATGSGAAYLASKFEPLTVAGFMPSPTSNLFNVQNTTTAGGIGYTARYFTVSSTSTLVNPANSVTGYKLGIGSSAPTAILDITGQSNVPLIDATGFTTTGADTMVNLAGTWNTGSNVVGLLINMTDTSSGVSSHLLRAETNSNQRFYVDKSGLIGTNISNSSSSFGNGRNIELRNNDASVNNFATISWTTGNNTMALIGAQYLNRTGNGTANLLFSTNDNSGTGATRLVIGATNTRVTNTLFGVGANTLPANLLTVGSATSTFEVDSAGNLIKINNVVYSWPSSQGGGSTVLQNNGSGGLSWAASGASANLNQAYLSSTSTGAFAEISITPSLGAVTIADTLSGTGNVFEIQDRTTAAGDYSQRYFTVSATSVALYTTAPAGTLHVQHTNASAGTAIVAKVGSNSVFSVDYQGNVVADYRITSNRSAHIALAADQFWPDPALTINPLSDFLQDLLLIKLGSATKVIVKLSGFMGIGNSAPANLLTVGSATSTFEVNTAGNLIRVNGVTYSWPSSQGGVSTVLQNNGSGTLTWAASGASANLNQAYLNATGSPELSINNATGAVTLSDQVGSDKILSASPGYSSIFEVTDRTNAAGAFSQRFLSVSSTSTNLTYNRVTTGTAASLAVNGLTTGTGLAISSTSANSMAGLLTLTADTTAGGTIESISGNALTTGRALSISSSSNNLSSGGLLLLTKTGSTSGSAFSGAVAEINYSQSYSSGLTNSGNTLLITRSNTGTGGGTVNIVGSVLKITDTASFSAGPVNVGGSVLEIQQNYHSATNTALRLTSSSTNGGGGAHIAAKFEPLTVAGYMPTPTSNLFNVQNTTTADGLGYTDRYFTISSTSTNLTYNSNTSDTAATITANALTTGDGLSITSSGTALTTGSLLNISTATTGDIAGGGVVSITATGNYQSTDTSTGLLNIAANSTTDGVIQHIQANALTGGIGLLIDSTSAGLASNGSLLRVDTATTGTLNSGVVRLSASANYASTANVGLLYMEANLTTAGTIAAINGNSLTTGVGLNIASTGAGAMTTGSLLKISTGSTGAVATNGIVSITSTGNYTSTSNAGLLNVAANSTAAGTVVNIQANALTSGIGLRVASTTTGAISNGIVRIESTAGYTSSSSTTGMLTLYSQTSTGGTMLGMHGDNTTTGTILHIDAEDLTTGNAIVVRSLPGAGIGITSGHIMDLGGSLRQSSANAVGSLTQITASDISTVTATSIGLHINPNFGSSSGSITRTLIGLKVAPTFSPSGSNCNSGAGHNCAFSALDVATMSHNVNTASTSMTLTGLNLSSPGSLGTAVAGTIDWRGIALTMPNMNISGGGIASVIGVKITGGTSSIGVKPAAFGSDYNAGGVGIGTFAPRAQLDVTGTATSTAIGSRNMSAVGNSVWVQGDYAFVTEDGGTDNIEIFDISDPAVPRNINNIAVGAIDPNAIVVEGRYAYIVGRATGVFHIYDVQNPLGPKQVATLSTGTNGVGPKRLAINGKRAYFTSASSTSIGVIDISDPTTPVLMTTVATSKSQPEDIVVSGKYAYVTTKGDASNDNVDIFDIQADRPILVSSFATGSNSNPESVYVQGKYMYVLNASASTLQIVSISNPAAPTLVGTFTSVGNNGYDVTVQGTRAYISMSSGIIQIVDVSNPAAPVSVGTLATGANPKNIFIQGRYLYVAHQGQSTGGFKVYDVGGAYIQQLEVGGLKTSRAIFTNLLQGNDATFTGGVNIGNSLNLQGGLAVSSSTSTNLFGDLVNFSLNPQTGGSATGTLLNLQHMGNGITLRAWSKPVPVMNVFEVLETSGAGIGQFSRRMFTVSSTSTQFFNGTMTVSSTGSLTIGSTLVVGNTLNSDNDTIYFDQSGQYMEWSNAKDLFDFSNDIEIDMSNPATANGVCHSNPNVAAAPGSNRQLVVCSGAPTDVAEMYPTVGIPEAGAILVATENTFTYEADQLNPLTGESRNVKAPQTVSILAKTSTPYSAKIIGVVSTSPAVNYGRDIMNSTSSTAPVALAGRVPTKVSTENGPIAIGDPITTSSVAGVGMRSTKPGMIVGYALNAWNGTGVGTIEVFVQPIWHSGMTIATDGMKSLFADDFAFKPLDVSSASGTSFSSYALNFSGSTWDNDTSATVSRNISIRNDITDKDTYQLTFKNELSQTIASLNNAGDLAIAGSLTVNGGFDYAETFPAAPDLDAGDIVMVDPDNSTGYGVKKSEGAYENSMVGVISTKPGFLTGKSAAGSQPVALAGRVPVKVSTESGEIKPGDPITSSSERGIGMKATEAGRVVGIALQGWNGTGVGTVLVFVNPSWWNGPAAVTAATAGSGLSITENSLLDFKNSTISNVSAIVSTTGLWSVSSDGFLVAEKVETKEVNTQKLTLKNNATTAVAERIVGKAHLTAGSDAILVQNAHATVDSIIMITFEGNPGSNWWISEKHDGLFMLKLAQPAIGDTPFTYWILPVDGALDPTAAPPDGSASGTPQTGGEEPPPDSGGGNPTGSGSGTGETGSGSSTDETP